jgi:ribonuclease T1
MATKKEFWLSVALAGLIGLGLGYFISKKSIHKNTNTPVVVNPNPNNSTDHHNIQPRNNNTEVTNNIPKGTIPQYALDVYDYVIKNKKAMEGYVGGREFKNKEGQLPMGSTYQEWDVKPKIQGQNRGAERLVTSQNGEGYYTSDHYKTFTKIK